MRIKDQGNAKYAAKNFKDAIERFTEGIKLYLKDVS